MTIPSSQIDAYREYLIVENKASSTIKESVRYVNRFSQFVGDKNLFKGLLDEYRQYIDGYYATYNGKNACISYINSFLKFLGHDEWQISYFKTSRTAVKLRTSPLTDEDITKLLHYASNYTSGE